MYCRVQDEAGNIYPKIGCSGLNYISLHINLYQRGGSDLVVKHSKWVEKKVLCFLADANLLSRKYIFIYAIVLLDCNDPKVCKVTLKLLDAKTVRTVT